MDDAHQLLYIIGFSDGYNKMQNPTKRWYDAHYAGRERRLESWNAAMLEWLRHARPEGPLLELGCGAGLLLECVVDEGLYADDAVHGIDQSETAVAEIATRLPGVRVGDIEAEMPYADGSMGVIIVAEVIEHLVHPWALFDRVHRVLRSGGVLLLSFPNYLHLPWLALRILADLCDRPAWIVLQPIDRMYTTPLVKRRLRERGFDIEAIIGNTYGPPKLHEWEPRWLRALLNGAHLGELSFHPVLVCRKR
jgi:2-polyprenyl-3-methyl-5-hydroxy-6-metoxy-1,4-benzoquinol methylase